MKRTSIKFIALLSWILTALFTGHIRADDKPEIYIQKGHSMWVRSVAISPDNKYIVSGSDDDTIRLWDVKSGKEIRTFIGHTDYVTSVSFTGGQQKHRLWK
jgi:WD40 repeat protein